MKVLKELLVALLKDPLTYAMVVFIVFLSIGLVDFAVLMFLIILFGGSILAAYNNNRKK
ncbi:hypothetical protein [Entomomonas moraniae]|uniref:hypothetical protein n=1 Tax=Entomomonas moraniae TaxID=2213226 RepID=UPI0013DF1934|nr:hypothetical protein [Entomomonas moraniae]